ncbi:MAG: DUF3015 family protein [Nitrospiraceae bacterium]
MTTTLRHRLLEVMGIMILGLTLSACGTTKATLDSTSNFLSSTTPGALLTEDGLVRQEQKINLFTGVAYENLRQESAAGGGEYLTSLAYLYDIPVARHGEFTRLVQNRHSDLFSTGLNEDQPAHLRMVQALNRALAADSFWNR